MSDSSHALVQRAIGIVLRDRPKAVRMVACDEDRKRGPIRTRKQAAPSRGGHGVVLRHLHIPDISRLGERCPQSMAHLLAAWSHTKSLDLTITDGSTDLRAAATSL